MNYRPFTLRHVPPQFWSDLLGIGWRLVLPVLVLAVMVEAEFWLEPMPVPPPAAVAPPHAAGLAGALLVLGQGLAAVFFFLGGLLIFGVLVVVQAFWSPMPSYRRFLHGRPWVLLLGAVAAVGWLDLGPSPTQLAAAWATRYYLSCGVLALGLPSLIEWLTTARTPRYFPVQ